MKRITVLAALLLAAAAISQAQEQVTIAGSSTIQPIVTRAAEEFEKTHPGVEFVIGGGGSGHGVKAAGTGEVVIGTSSRDLHDDEKTLYPDLVTHLVGRDGIAVIVSARNQVQRITKDQVQAIYSGRITNWKDVGGDDVPVHLVSIEEGRSTVELFLQFFELEGHQTGEGRGAKMVHRVKGTEAWSSVEAQVIGPNNEAIATVTTKAGAIGYVSIGTAQQVIAKGGRIRILELDGVVGSVENVGNGTYPLRRNLNLVTKGEPRGLVKEFIEYLRGPAGQEIVKDLEFIPIGATNGG